jgi:hypothetical protein
MNLGREDNLEADSHLIFAKKVSELNSWLILDLQISASVYSHSTKA